MPAEKLFMLLLGCRPPGRFTEQHDIFFGIGEKVADLIPGIKKFWPEAKSGIHVDAWREVSCVDGHSIKVEAGSVQKRPDGNIKNLFFINLGGYKENEFDEFHYKVLVVANNLEEAKDKAKRTAFFKHATIAPAGNYFKASSHIDDKYGVDTDDAFAVKDILPAAVRGNRHIVISGYDTCLKADDYHLGFFKLPDLASYTTER